MGSIARRNNLDEQDLEMEVLVRANFHVADNDYSGTPSTAWVPLRYLHETADGFVAQVVVKRFLDLSFTAAKDEFDCDVPQEVRD